MTRRELLALASRLGAAGVALRLGSRLPAFAQEATADAWGKAKLIARSIRPPDYETPVALLDSFITPTEHFFVRSHMPVPPAGDPSAWRLEIAGDVGSSLMVSLDELRKMPQATVTMTLECAGNGRAFFDPPVAGIQWQRGAVGTARWTGVRLADLLKRAGVNPAARFVIMSAADSPLGTMPDFVRQIPMAKAMDPDTVVAYEMNGQPIPRVHGAPLRAIVPGWEGAYSMKWLTGLRVSAAESDNFWVASAYRYPVKRVAPGAAVDAKDMAPLAGLAVKSIITQPIEGATLRTGEIAVAGFAWAGTAEITRVDVSSDAGATWQPARLTGERARYAWRRFEIGVKAARPESLLIMSRATDASGRVQPAIAQWNPSGYLWNQPDWVRVEVAG
jgi:DMSO/TMAO reductase YedYZ molybdopterin-dependent catalytic subunit